MNPVALRAPWCLALALLLACLGLAGPRPRTGPATEKRFPPLKLPPGFQATLFACDPLIEYPSAIALGPRPGTLFVAVDYMTGLGTEIVRRDEVRLIEDTDGDGYADRATVYAGGFNSIQGLAYHDGTVYVMHAPFLTALRDTKGDGKPDQRRNLLSGLGPPPEKNPLRLHAANGVVVGHDGWLYLALGDLGCDVQRPEGDRLVLHGGGILRCRPDGRGLHVFATGLRNIYDIALDADLNVFVRDNENDGGTYMIRVCHSFFGADHGYPYLYDERPGEALPPLADLGLGSSAGGVCYLERQFPARYRGRLFFCEWGRSVVSYQPRRQGSGFGRLKEEEFASGAANDPYGFKPTDLVVDRDGSLFVSDWADGQRPKRGRGRIYRITRAGHKPAPPRRSLPNAGLDHWIGQLDSDSHHQRVQAQEMIQRRGLAGVKAVREALGKGHLGVVGRLHAVWIVARSGGPDAAAQLFNLARSDRDPRVQAQAVRAIADLTDPVLLERRLDAGPPDAKLAQRLADWGKGKAPPVLLEVTIALGRFRWSGAPGWLQEALARPDDALAHAAMQTLRRSANWPAVLKLADGPDTDPLRTIALRALADQFVPQVVDGLIPRLGRERDSSRRRAWADALTRVHRKPGPWSYWGYRPPPRPANTVAWERTRAIEDALDRVLAGTDHGVRLAVLRRMQREKIPTRLATLDRWVRAERLAGPIAILLDSVRAHPPEQTRVLLEAVVKDRHKPAASRLAALTLWAGALKGASAGRLMALAGAVEDGPVLAEVLRQLGRRPGALASTLFLGKLRSRDPVVRAAATDAVAARRLSAGAGPVEELLDDRDAGVRRAAATAAGALGIHRAASGLLRRAHDTDPAVRAASLESLRLLEDVRAVRPAITGLTHQETQLAALRCLEKVGGPGQASVVADCARRNPSAEVLPLALRLIGRWSKRPSPGFRALAEATADLQGAAGALACWDVAGPLPAREAPSLVRCLAAVPAARVDEKRQRFQTLYGTGTAMRIRLPAAEAGSIWLAYSDLRVPRRMAVQFLAGSNSPLRIWLNGRQVHEQARAGPFRPESQRFEAVLAPLTNRLLVQLAAGKGPVEFHLRFRLKASTAEREQLAQAALARPGNAERGAKLFFDSKKSLCLDCHRLGDRGERIGPDLTGVGSRLARVYLIESILEPSRTIAPGYQTVTLYLKDGRQLTGVQVAQTDTSIILADNQGKKHTVANKAVEQERTERVSIMPDGLEKRFSAEEFVDLIAFLVSQKERRQR
jgi:putative membrane-bound dehydrogenase-like protein